MAAERDDHDRCVEARDAAGGIECPTAQIQARRIHGEQTGLVRLPPLPAKRRGYPLDRLVGAEFARRVCADGAAAGGRCPGQAVGVTHPQHRLGVSEGGGRQIVLFEDAAPPALIRALAPEHDSHRPAWLLRQQDA